MSVILWSSRSELTGLVLSTPLDGTAQHANMKMDMMIMMMILHNVTFATN